MSESRPTTADLRTINHDDLPGQLLWIFDAVPEVDAVEVNGCEQAAAAPVVRRHGVIWPRHTSD